MAKSLHIVFTFTRPVDIEGESLATQRKFPGALWKYEAAYTISAERLANGGRTAGPYRRDFSKIS
jgi:hypothetical protein